MKEWQRKDSGFEQIVYSHYEHKSGLAPSTEQSQQSNISFGLFSQSFAEAE